MNVHSLQYTESLPWLSSHYEPSGHKTGSRMTTSLSVRRKSKTTSVMFQVVATSKHKYCTFLKIILNIYNTTLLEKSFYLLGQSLTMGYSSWNVPRILWHCEIGGLLEHSHFYLLGQSLTMGYSSWNVPTILWHCEIGGLLENSHHTCYTMAIFAVQPPTMLLQITHANIYNTITYCSSPMWLRQHVVHLNIRSISHVHPVLMSHQLIVGDEWAVVVLMMVLPTWQTQHLMKELLATHSLHYVHKLNAHSGDHVCQCVHVF
jgi:hypothetical protein